MSKYIYFIHSSTTSVLSRTIGLYTRNKYNHVSISFEQDLSEVYSFGRKEIHNPLIGGFVQEDMATGLFTEATCSIYRLAVSEAEFLRTRHLVREFEGRQSELRYNFLGLVFLSWGMNITRADYYFCSEFAATLIRECTSINLPKPANFMMPQDLAELPGMEGIFEGQIATYREFNELSKFGYPLEWHQRSYDFNPQEQISSV